MFPLCSQLLGSGVGVEVMSVLVPVTSGEQCGERRHDRHQEVLISFPTITLLFVHVGGIWAFLTGTKCENKHHHLWQHHIWLCCLSLKQLLLRVWAGKAPPQPPGEVRDEARPRSLCRYGPVVPSLCWRAQLWKYPPTSRFPWCCCTAWQETSMTLEQPWCSPRGPSKHPESQLLHTG